MGMLFWIYMTPFMWIHMIRLGTWSTRIISPSHSEFISEGSIPTYGHGTTSTLQPNFVFVTLFSQTTSTIVSTPVYGILVIGFGIQVQIDSGQAILGIIHYLFDEVAIFSILYYTLSI
jgi:hypothetical protein